jgi:hypothetical protein
MFRETNKQSKLRGFSPQANYTDRSKLVPILRIEGVPWSAQRIPTAVNLGFLDLSRYFSNEVATQLSSRGSVDPVPAPLLLRKSGSAGSRTRDLCICSQKLWPLDHRGGVFREQPLLILKTEPNWNRWKLKHVTEEIQTHVHPEYKS